MKKVFYPALLCLLLSTSLQAQKAINNPLVNSKEVIAKGILLHDEGKYKEAINEFLKVPASDTGYSDGPCEKERPRANRLAKST